MSMSPEELRAIREGQPFDPNDLDARSARLEGARAKLQEYKNGPNGPQNRSTNGRTPSTRTADRPSGFSPSYGGSSDEEGEGAFDSDEYPTGRTLGDHARALADIRAAPSSGGTDGGRDKKHSGRPAQGNRQTARKEVPEQSDGITEQILGLLKRALAYAGFDVTGDADALTATEADVLVPQVSTFFQRIGMGLDWTLTHANARHEESDIWVFEESEARTLAYIYLKRARKVGWMAQVARQVRHLEDVGDVRDLGLIVGKRLGASVVFIPSNGGLKPWLK